VVQSWHAAVVGCDVLSYPTLQVKQVVRHIMITRAATEKLENSHFRDQSEMDHLDIFQ